jgi:hypothetical protein
VWVKRKSGGGLYLDLRDVERGINEVDVVSLGIHNVLCIPGVAKKN